MVPSDNGSSPSIVIKREDWGRRYSIITIIISFVVGWWRGSDYIALIATCKSGNICYADKDHDEMEAEICSL